MADFHVTQAKINALIEELRSWETGGPQKTLHGLAHKFGLDIFVVDRVVRSEGVRLSREKPQEDQGAGADPNASTLDLDPDEIHEALSKPDPNPDYQEDADTGVWRKDPTGGWERVGPGHTQDETED